MGKGGTLSLWGPAHGPQPPTMFHGQVHKVAGTVACGIFWKESHPKGINPHVSGEAYNLISDIPINVLGRLAIFLSPLLIELQMRDMNGKE